jgi:hypothetical protein
MPVVIGIAMSDKNMSNSGPLGFGDKRRESEKVKKSPPGSIAITLSPDSIKKTL